MADKSKNTGTGGINIDGKVYTPDVGVPDLDGGAQGDYSSGDINVDKTTKDISKPTRETFAKYLSKTTLGTAGSSPHKNVYPVGAGDQTQVEEIKLKDTQGNPVSPGPQNNETKFAAGFNQTISSNNPAGIKRGLTTSTGQDGNTLLPSASTAADPGGNYVKFVTTAGVKGLQEPIKTYTNTTIDPNLYDYDSNKVGISDGTLNQSPSGLREDIRIISTNSNVETDGGTSKNILGADNGQGDYTLTATEARALAGTTTAKNRFPIDITPSVVTLRDASGNPVSVTASQNSVTNASFFTKLVEEKKEGDKTVQVISVRELSSYTPALTSAASVDANKFEIKRGKTVGGTIDGNELLLTIAPEKNGVVTLTPAAKTYTDEVIKPNLNNYSTTEVGISDGALGAAPSNTREDLKYIPSDASIKVDGGKSVNILGADGVASPDYTLTLADRAAQASIITTGNFFKIDVPEVKNSIVTTKKIIDVTPLSATDSQNSPFNTSYFSLARTSYTNALTTAAQSAQNKFIIKRGKTEKTDGIDGNSLLSTIAPEANNVATLTLGAQTYTDAVLDPNLNDVYNPRTHPQSGVVIPEYEDSGIPTGIKDLNKTYTFAEDGGTSENILGGKRKLTILDAANIGLAKTTNNFYPLDEASTDLQDNKKVLEATIISSVNKLAKTNNTKYFADIAIGSNPTVNSKGKLKNQGDKDPYKNKDLPDGNTLLSNATIAAIPGGKYVKPAKELNDPIKSYTTEVVATNLYDFGSQNIDIDNVKALDFFGPKLLYKPKSGPEDAGTFDNIKSNPVGRVLSKLQTQNYFQDEIIGKNQVPGQIKNELTPYYGLNPLPSDFSINDTNGFPASPSNAQTAGKFIDNRFPELTEYVYGSEIPTSYSENVASLDIRRGKSEGSAPSGHKLLKDAAKPATAGPYIKPAGEVSVTIDKYVSSVLEKNRYNPKDRNQFVPSDTPGAESLISIGGGGAAKGGQRFENISDNVSAAERDISFVERTKLYAPSQLTLGESPQSMSNRGKPVTGFTFRRLTRIGTILQLRAAGEIISITGDQNDDPRSNVEQLAAALVPGLGQAGAGVPLSRELLNVTEIIKNLPDESTGAAGVNTKAQYEGELIDINRNFEGVVNTALEKFSGFSSLGLLVLALALVAVILVVVWAIIGNIASSSSALDRTEKYPAGIAGKNDRHIRGIGSFQGATMGGGTNFIADLARALTSIPPSGAVSLFGITPTYNREYSDAVYRGALAFFGFGSSPPPFLSYPGQVVVTSRAIVRGAAQLVTAFVDIGSAFASGNVFSAIFKLIDIIEIIRNSKVVKALNTFSQIGDRKPYTIVGGLYAKQSTSADVVTDFTKNPLAAPSAATIAQEKTDNPELYDRTDSQLDAGVKISEIDSVLNVNNKHKIKLEADKNGNYNKEYIGLSQVKSRLNDADGKLTRALAWSTYRAASLHVDVRKLQASFDGQYDVSKVNGSADKQTFSAVGPRINPDIVKSFENALDGEYMPFYFHDLRTNEIIGLHAFLLSLTDDYTANYESISGIGRAEPVKIYKDTQRKIGFSFILAALDDEDFNHMWDKVNRLTMLAYPQYTRGKLYNNSTLGIQFEKPFTQQVAAAPMVRLRLGNLFRSNYSKFNIAKIFGLGVTGIKVALSDEQKTQQVNAAKEAAEARGRELVNQAKAEVKKELEADKTLKYEQGYEFHLTKASIYKTRLDDKVAKNVGLEQENAKPLPKDLNDKAKKNATARYVEGGDWYRTMDGDKDTKLRFKISNVYPERGDPQYAQGTFVVVGDANESDKSLALPNIEFFVPISDLEMDAATKVRYNADLDELVEDDERVEQAEKNQPQPTVSNETIVTSEADFISSEKNVIVKSFESAGGKGLAGFIDSMSFDWYDRVTWDIDVERKAPKMCKVTISFTPVHDIAPGLDAYGNNRAPIYPLGPYAYGTRKMAGTKE
jgi:hypothetical protein